MSEVKNIPDGWIETTLLDVTSHLGDGLHGTPNYSDDGEYYFINGNNLKDGKIEIKPETKKCSIEEYTKYKKNLNDRTILVSINGSLGYFAYYNNEKCFLGKSACYFNVKENIDKRFIGYQIRSQYFQKYIERLAGGTTIKNVSLKTMREFPFLIPNDVQEQKSIASILTAFDDKIELLQAQNKTLEEMAQTIFKEWFGKYGFDSELPEDWSLKTLKDVCLKITDGTHSTVIDNSEGSCYLLSCKNIKNGQVIINQNDRKIDKETLAQLRKRTGLQYNDLLVTTVGTIGEVAMIREEDINYELQRSVAIIRPNLEKISPEFLYQFSRSHLFQHQAISLADGSVQTCLFLGAINMIEIVIPPRTLMLEFEKIASYIYLKVIANSNHIKTLTKTRDELLPRLMSGELRVKN